MCVRNKVVLAALASFLLSLPPLSASPVIQRGIDAFTTVADGRTFYSFANNPIPAGFFCPGSKAFTGRVDFKGLPLATETPGQLWGADTVIERLDDVALDERGYGKTRLQFRALSLVSVAPVKTSCGAFHVYASLAGKQRVTTMEISRTQERGGSFFAPLAVDVRMTFIPEKPAKLRNQPNLELTAAFTFPVEPLPWSFETSSRRIGAVKVDTNGDLSPDALLPGASNFAPGRSPGRQTTDKFGCPQCAQIVCHAVATEDEHCYYETVFPGCPDVMVCE